jgi:hypothetical protein
MELIIKRMRLLLEFDDLNVILIDLIDFDCDMI